MSGFFLTNDRILLLKLVTVVYRSEVTPTLTQTDEMVRGCLPTVPRCSRIHQTED